MAAHRVLAVALGATSVRVAAIDLDAPEPDVQVVHRWAHGPVPDADGHLRWDWDGIVAEVERGLERGLVDGPVASIGVDGWAVDYGLLDDAGALVAPPFSYRDDRTDGWGEVVDRVGADRLYGITGIQLMQINTIFQLAAHDPALLDKIISTSAAAALLSYSLYTMSPGTIHLHGTENLIYTIPLVAYGMFRYLYLLHAKRGGTDASRDLFRDPHVFVAVLAWAAVTAWLIV
jgi:sugar (pentulose or hexulose) kinase